MLLLRGRRGNGAWAKVTTTVAAPQDRRKDAVETERPSGQADFFSVLDDSVVDELVVDESEEDDDSDDDALDGESDPVALVVDGDEDEAA